MAFKNGLRTALFSNRGSGVTISPRDLQEDLTQRLRCWGGLNLVAGIGLARRPEPFWRGFGVQAFGWGAVNALIAQLARWSLVRRRAVTSGSSQPEGQADENRKLSRLLMVNTVLDVFYVLGGWSLLRSRGQEDPFWRGTSWGIATQGAFLFLFDLVHLLQLLRETK